MLLLRSLFVLLVLLGPSKMIAQVNFSQIVLSGDSAPGVADGDFLDFEFPSINATGDVAFWASLNTQLETSGIFGPTSGVGSPLGMLAITGATAPGTGGEVFDVIFRDDPPAINGSGDVAFGARLLNGECAVFGPTSGAGSPLGLVAIANAPAPGTDGAEYQFLGSVGSLDDSGGTSFLAILQTGTGPPVDPSNWAAIFGPTSGAGSPVDAIAREDTPAPGVDDGSEFDFFFVPVSNASGDVAFLGGLRTGTGPVVNSSSSQAIFGPTSGPGSPLGPVAREGDAAPGANGAMYAAFFAPAINASGDVTFNVLLRTEAETGEFIDAGEAIYGPTAGAGSSLGLIARENTPAPGLADGAEFADVSLFPSINAPGTIAFTAALRTGTGPVVNESNDGALFTSVAGQLRCILREGDQITVTLADNSTEERTVGSIELSQAGLNDAGTMALLLSFTDGSQGIFTADVSTASPLLGDVNLDNTVNFFDIAPFIAVLAYQGNQAEADANQDGVVDFFDIASFIDILAAAP